MSIFHALLSSSLTYALGWTLVHFLWQGVAVGLIYAALRHRMRGKSSAARYHLAIITLIAMAILPILTFLHLFHPTTASASNDASQSIIGVFTIGASGDVHAPLSLLDQLKIWLRVFVPWAVPLWLLGVFWMMLRAWNGWQHARHLRKAAEFAPLPEWNAVVKSLCARLGVNKLVRLAISISVTVPSVIGWLRPIILLPPSAIVGLTPLQMELILSHELAHIRRQDYLWNLLQIAVETLLFYHPVVRWVSRHARLEREQCCDDMVVRLHGNTIDYARALTELESLRYPHAAMVLGADGGQVLDRIHRMLGQPTQNAAVSWLPLLLATGLLFAAGLISVVHQYTSLPALLTTKYTLTGNAEQPALSANTSRLGLAPTRINAIGITQPVPQSVRRLANFESVPLMTLPFLKAPAPPAATPAVPVNPTPTAHTPVRQGGQVVVQFPATYPPFAQERGVEGSATVEFTLTPDGGIANLRVVRVDGSRLFGDAAMNAIRRWKFTPVTIGGVPAAQDMSLEFVFRLHDSAQSSGTCQIPMGYHVCAK